MLQDMKNKKIFQTNGGNVRNMLEDLSYDEDEDDDDVTMYKFVFSHEKTTLPEVKTRRTPVKRNQTKTKSGLKTTKTLAMEIAQLNTTNTTCDVKYKDMESFESDNDILEVNDEPKHITSNEAPLYEYYFDKNINNQTILRRVNTTKKGIRVKTTAVTPVFNSSDQLKKKKTRIKKIKTTTEHKMLRTAKFEHRFENKYDHLDIGKLPNTTIEKEKDCLEKEIVHIFDVGNMKSYVKELVHYYKHYRSHFNDVINLVSNVSIFNIETDNVEDCVDNNKTAFLYQTKPYGTNQVLSPSHVNHLEQSIQTTKSTTTASPKHLKFMGNNRLNEKFDLAALNNLFNNEKKIITSYDRTKYDKIYYNMKKIIHCLKLNLNLKKYNFINETNVNDLMDIIWNNRIKYDESAYESEYEELYDMAKTIDYYEVPDREKEHYEYYLNKDSGIDDEAPYTRNPENQEVIKAAMRNVSRIRKERHEFECGILEGQVKNKCHYCGKNYSESQEFRYMKHVHNHIVDELEGSNYWDGVYLKDGRVMEKAFAHMTKAPHSTYPTIDLFPYYENFPSNEFDYRFESDNHTTKSFKYFVKLKKRQDEKKKKIEQNFADKNRRFEKDRDLEDIRKIMDNKDFVTFSDESLPMVLKRFIQNYGNDTGLTLKKKDIGDVGEEVGERGEEIPKAYEDLFKSPEEKTQEKENILGKFKEKKEKQDEYRMNELKQAANELLKHKDWRSRLDHMNQKLQITTDIDLNEREIQIKKIQKSYKQRYQKRILKEKEQREMEQMWYQDNLNVDKWVFKTNVWTTLKP